MRAGLHSIYPATLGVCCESIPTASMSENLPVRGKMIVGTRRNLL